MRKAKVNLMGTPLWFIILLITNGIGHAKRPNIVVIYTDDQRFDALGVNGNQQIKTPNLDTFIRRGVNFTNCHVTLSLCSPSRAALLSGKYGSVNGVNLLGGALRKGITTFPQKFSEAGYQCFLSGKWHLKQSPSALGFSKACYFYGNGTYYGRKVIDQGVTKKPKKHVDLFCAERSADFIAEHADKPFLLFHCTQTPHMDGKLRWPSAPQFRKLYQGQQGPLPDNWNDPYLVKPPYLPGIRNRRKAIEYGYQSPDKIRSHALEYYSVVSEMDASLKHIFDVLSEKDLWENTYIVFLSDNGWMLGDHGFSSKVLAYEASTKVPLAIVGPDIAPRTEPSPVLHIDVTRTLYELAGIEAKGMHGRSLVPHLQGKTDHSDRILIYECLEGYGGNKPIYAAHNNQWLFIQTLDKTGKRVEFTELYDKQKDPWEMKNLAHHPSFKDVIQLLENAIQRHQNQMKKELNEIDTLPE